MNNYMLRLNTDELQTVSNKIEKTSKEIDNVLNKMISINNNVISGWNDDNAKEFTDNFGRYLNEVKGIVNFYNEINSNIKKYANQYESTDLDMSKKVPLELSSKSTKTTKKGGTK